MQPKNKNRPLLPGPPAKSISCLNKKNNTYSPSTADSADSEESSQKRRHVVSKACNRCREKKIRCNGLEPCCTCQSLDLDCEYASVSKTILNSIPQGMKLVDEKGFEASQNTAALLSALCSLPKHQVGPVLDDLRAGKDVLDIITSLQDRLQSAHEAPLQRAMHRSTAPHASSLEFELRVRHTVAYPPWTFTKLPYLSSGPYSESGYSSSRESSSKRLCVPLTNIRPNFRATELEPVSYTTKAGMHHKRPGEPDSNASLNFDCNIGSGGCSNMEPYPIHDERLQHAIHADAAKRVLSLYLETEHKAMPLFDAGLFLGDLMAGRDRFCSKLLVSAIMSWACQAYTRFDLEAASWSLSFYEEATEILRGEGKVGAEAEGVTQLAALLLLNMTSICHATHASRATNYLSSAIDLAKDMGLFGVTNTGVLEKRPESIPNLLWERALAQAAWGGFVYVTIQHCQDQDRNFLHPPQRPIPDGTDNFHDGPSSREQANTALKQETFPSFCKLALIANDMMKMNSNRAISKRMAYENLKFMESTYQRYLKWADNLPVEMARSSESSQHVLLLHMHLHAFVLDLFRPLVQHREVMSALLESFASPQASPEAICAASISQLRRVALAYTQNHEPAICSFGYNRVLLYLANSALRDPSYATDKSERRSDLMHCIKVYIGSQSCFRLAWGIVRSLLFMALREKLVDITEAKALLQDSENKGQHHYPISGPIQAPFVVDLDLAMVNPEAASVGRLAADFNSAMSTEFVKAQG